MGKTDVACGFGVRIDGASSNGASSSGTFGNGISGNGRGIHVRIVAGSALSCLGGNNLACNMDLSNTSPMRIGFGGSLGRGPRGVCGVCCPAVTAHVISRIVRLRLPTATSNVRALALAPGSPTVIFRGVIVSKEKKGKEIGMVWECGVVVEL